MTDKVISKPKKNGLLVQGPKGMLTTSETKDAKEKQPEEIPEKKDHLDAYFLVLMLGIITLVILLGVYHNMTTHG